ncbi:MAG: sulfite exporter TauE/SafE family protein [Chloroflexota bacterium]|nr:sulfite exporter TauE/SafE family protein [Anaerolineales bacterium]MCB8965830.1 sulfite exporter TauE/SafE family protein [Ardenticatenaceae bacterium]
MLNTIILVVVIFGAAFLQTLSGFGFALIVMPLAVSIAGMETAAPLIALTGLTLYTINLFRYRHAVNMDELKRLGLAAAIGVPVGMALVTHLPETTIRFALGLLLVGYALYALFLPPVTAVPSPHWRYLAGFLAGCLGGAYNVPGPPVIIYGSASQWPKDQFRAVLQSLFFLQGLLVVGGHILARHVTSITLTTYLYAIPALLGGIFLGARLDGKVNKPRFRVLVTIMILCLGISLLF